MRSLLVLCRGCTVRRMSPVARSSRRQRTKSARQLESDEAGSSFFCARSLLRAALRARLLTLSRPFFSFPAYRPLVSALLNDRPPYPLDPRLAASLCSPVALIVVTRSPLTASTDNPLNTTNSIPLYRKTRPLSPSRRLDARPASPCTVPALRRTRSRSRPSRNRTPTRLSNHPIITFLPTGTRPRPPRTLSINPRRQPVPTSLRSRPSLDIYFPDTTITSQVPPATTSLRASPTPRRSNRPLPPRSPPSPPPLAPPRRARSPPVRNREPPPRP